MSDVDRLFLNLVVQRGLATQEVAQACLAEFTQVGGSLPRLMLHRAGLDEHVARSLYQEASSTYSLQSALNASAQQQQAMVDYSADPDASRDAAWGAPPPMAHPPAGFARPVSPEASSDFPGGFGAHPSSSTGSNPAYGAGPPTPTSGFGAKSFGPTGRFGGSAPQPPPSGSMRTHNLQAGSVFHGFRLERELGRGGMGVVWRARQLNLERDVALKMLLQGSFATPELRARFLQETKAVARLTHPNVVSIHDQQEQDGILFFTMDLVDGPSLSALLKTEDVGVDRALRIGADICEGLQHAHDQGLIHRDLKPGNVLIDSRGAARITDFGIAKDTTSQASNTREGEILGTPGYMSPEQANGGAEVDQRSDVYSVGAILFRILAGRAPFTGETSYETITSVLNDPAPKLRSFNVNVPVELEKLVARTLSKNPGDRPQRASELGKALRRLQRKHGAPTSSALHERARGGPSTLTTALVAAGIVLVLGVGLGLGIHGYRSALRAKEEAAAHKKDQEEHELQERLEREKRERDVAHQRFQDAKRLARTDPKGALKIVEEVGGALAGELEVSLLQASLLRETGEVKRALEIAKAACDQAPKSVPVWTERGRCHLALRQEAALEAATEALDGLGKPGKLEALRLRATWSESRERVALAIDHLQEACGLAPKEGDLHVWLTRLQVEVGRYKAASESGQVAARLSPNSAEAFGLLATAHYQLGDLERSRKAARRGLGIDPREPRSTKVMDQLSKAKPKDPVPPPSRGHNHDALQACLGALQKGDRKTAERYLAPERNKQLSCATGLMLRHRCLFGLGDVKGALQDLEALSRLNGHHAEARKLEGRLCAQLGAKGLEILRGLAQHQPKDPSRQFAIGEFFAARGERKPAEAAFQAALTLDPNYHEAYHERSHMRAQAKDLPGALDDVNACLRIAPGGHYFMMKAQILKALGKSSDARDCLKQAIRYKDTAEQARAALSHFDRKP